MGLEEWSREIEPFVRLARSRKGFLTAVVRKLNVEAKRRKHAVEFLLQHVGPYFASDAAKRVEPRAGFGMILLDVCDKVAKETE